MLSFPVAREALGSYMDRSTWIFEQERHFLALRKSYFQFERLQTYQEPGNPSYDAFAAGDHGRARLIAHEAAAQEEEDLRRVCHKGVPYTRVHAIERPLTPYLRWEFAIYQVLARYGQRVLLVELDARSPREFVDSYDFLLFDYEFVMVQDYGQDGLLCGGWTTGDPALVARFAQLARDLTRAAIPLAEFERRYAHDLQPPA